MPSSFKASSFFCWTSQPPSSPTSIFTWRSLWTHLCAKACPHLLSLLCLPKAVAPLHLKVLWTICVSTTYFYIAVLLMPMFSNACIVHVAPAFDWNCFASKGHWTSSTLLHCRFLALLYGLHHAWSLETFKPSSRKAFKPSSCQTGWQGKLDGLISFVVLGWRA